MLNDEEWRPIDGHEGAYEVSNQGRVRSLDREVERPNRWGSISIDKRKGRVLKAVSHQGGHLFVQLGRKNPHFVHRLVLAAFVRQRLDGEECRHLDGNPKNNRVENLAWGTRFENMADRKLLGEENPPRGTRNPRAKFAESDIHYIRQQTKLGRSFAQVARDIGASRAAVGKVAMGYTWSWLK